MPREFVKCTAGHDLSDPDRSTVELLAIFHTFLSIIQMAAIEACWIFIGYDQVQPNGVR